MQQPLFETTRSEESLEELFEEYAQLAYWDRQGLANEEQRERRFALRNIMAGILNDPSTDSRPFIERILAGDDTNITTDGDYFAGTGRVEAPFTESIVATELSLQIAQEAIEQLRTLGIAGFLAGSLVYARYFNIRRDSDIDIVVITETIDPTLAHNPLFAEFKDQMESALLAEGERLDNFIARPTIRGKKVTVHFIRQSKFEEICDSRFDQLLTAEPFRTMKFRKRGAAKGQSARRNFQGGADMWPVDEEETPFGIAFTNPILAIEEDGLAVYGPDIDRFLVSAFAFGNADYYNQHMHMLLLNLMQRLTFEEKQGLITKGIGALRNICNRQPFFPDFYRRIVNQNESNIREQLEQ